MTGIEKNCSTKLHMRAKSEQICVGQWQRTGERGALRCVSDEWESVDRGLAQEIFEMKIRE